MTKIRNLFLAMFSIVFIACSSYTEDMVFSCDANIDAWARENLQEIRTLTRAQWHRIEGSEHRRAAFVAFIPEQKRVFWVQKLQEALQLGWNEKESAHIQTLLEFAENSGVFERRLSRGDEVFFYRWGKYAQEELGWSDETIYSIAMSGYSLMDKTGMLRIPLENNVSRLRTGVEPPCACRAGHSRCGLGSLLVCVRSNDCEPTSIGCAYFWLGPCDGFCVQRI